ncbi:class I SAM-dependent methyltransferase [Virgibacillus byunsanensis]|uniref:Class I SAM-dependent methyltransferase n=1 Tax=Virgibacillus byunsanensis TaxID=570945 RepID=A0ABW3LL91_9BACI
MNNKDSVKKTFSTNKEAYISSSTHAKESDLTLITDWLNPSLQMVALDIATGGGHVAKQLSSFVSIVVATDLTEEMLENTAKHLQDYKNITYKIADAENLPFMDDIFDIVTCRIAAHHFPNPDRYIYEVARVLKSKGKFLFIDNIAPTYSVHDQFINTLEKIRDNSHNRSRTILEWKNILTSSNLSILKELTRKKRLPYQEWLERTVEDKNDQEKVNQYILAAPQDIREYFQFDIDDTTIHSFSIDEWMVMCEK